MIGHGPGAVAAAGPGTIAAVFSTDRPGCVKYVPAEGGATDAAATPHNVLGGHQHIDEYLATFLAFFRTPLGVIPVHLLNA
jgi:hypothetical protein